MLDTNKEKPGNSKVQMTIEEHIFKQIQNGHLKIEGFKLDEIKSGKPETGDTKFQVDFFIQNELIGEVYACKSKLLPGQRKKIYSDILKMLTIEKIWGIPVPKVYVMVLSQSEFTEQNLPLEHFISNEHEGFKILNNLGENSWIQKTIELFGFNVYYYLLCPNLSQSLETQQANQKR